MTKEFRGSSRRPVVPRVRATSKAPSPRRYREDGSSDDWHCRRTLVEEHYEDLRFTGSSRLVVGRRELLNSTNFRCNPIEENCHESGASPLSVPRSKPCVLSGVRTDKKMNCPGIRAGMLNQIFNCPNEMLDRLINIFAISYGKFLKRPIFHRCAKKYSFERFCSNLSLFELCFFNLCTGQRYTEKMRN